MISVLDVMNIVGAVAFAVAGALVAVRHRMDIFGVNTLAIITATGGGLIRDLLMGVVPPVMFREPRYVLISVITANILFLWMYLHKGETPQRLTVIYEKALLLSDTLGLAAFTVGGVLAGWRQNTENSLFFIVYLGVLTGVGGGLLRDVCANTIPSIFIKRVYAVASIAGGLATGLLLKHSAFGSTVAAVAGSLIIIMIRLLAAHYRWSLPRLPEASQQTKEERP